MADPVQFITDFEDINIPGKRYLRETLANCQNPMDEIREFQDKNGIILPSLQPMLPLLDLHGVRRLEFHFSVMEELRTKLIGRIEEINKMENAERNHKLKELLNKSFPLIKIPTLQPVVLTLLKVLENVEDRYLKALIADRELYQKVDVGVKRFIWQEHQNLFADEVTPLLNKYIKDKAEIFAKIKDPQKTFFMLSPKVRRKNDVLIKLAEMVGKNVLLYDKILQFIRTIFLLTSNPHYCTLRVSLLMELHDGGVTDITQMDPCHKFAWCLDACIREKLFESKRVRELQGFLENVPRGQDSVLGDLAMALADPYAVNFIAQSIIKALYSQISQEQLPRNHNVLQFLLRLLNLGLHAYDILKSQVFKEPKLDINILIKFIPILVSFMVDDQVRSVNAKLPTDDRESALTIIEHSGPPSDEFLRFVSEDRLAAVLTIYYTAQAARMKDREAVIRVFGALSTAHEGRTFADQYMHILVSGLIQLGDEFCNEEFCSIIFDEIFLPALCHGSTVLHLIKLIWHTHSVLPQDRLHSLLRKIEASLVQLVSPESIKFKELFVELEEKIKKATTDKEVAATAVTTIASGSSISTATGPTQTSAQSYNSSTGSEMNRVHPMMTPSPTTPYSVLSPSPTMSPFNYNQSPGPFSPISMSPHPYQSPFHPN
ncbi:hypothetical protein RDWZM_008836 [Blomia tropicalis]|uniref:Negative elongation factor B n=1 Tax=Blomia tropicalis TaxID=40697 RepID=A0A9Q0M244_BLOTA|nr:hypothetical protein RDWZM_008836 [Blomia tropicalis]